MTMPKIILKRDWGMSIGQERQILEDGMLTFVMNPEDIVDFLIDVKEFHLALDVAKLNVEDEIGDLCDEAMARIYALMQDQEWRRLMRIFQKGWGFRNLDRQRELYERWKGGRAGFLAAPGTSLHNEPWAFDFGEMS